MSEDVARLPKEVVDLLGPEILPRMLKMLRKILTLLRLWLSPLKELRMLSLKLLPSLSQPLSLLISSWRSVTRRAEYFWPTRQRSALLIRVLWLV
jgi:hypothetical protein